MTTMTRKGRLWVPADGAPNVAPRVKTLEGMIELPPIRFQGWCHVERLRDGKVIDSASFRNTILNVFLNNLGSTGNYPFASYLTGYMAVGTSGAGVDATNGGLIAEFNPTTRTAATGSVSPTYGDGDPDTYCWYKVTRLFTESQVNGNLTEFGMSNGSGPSAGVVFMFRQLFKDGLGNPTVISKTVAEQLRVTYEMRMYPPAADFSSTINLSGTNYDYTLRPANYTSGGGGSWRNLMDASDGLGYWPSSWQYGFVGEPNTLQPRTTSVAANTGWSVCTPQPYVADTFYKDIDYQYDPGNANFGSGVGSWAGGPGRCQVWQIVFPVKLPKTNTKRLVLRMRHAWNKYP